MFQDSRDVFIIHTFQSSFRSFRFNKVKRCVDFLEDEALRFRVELRRYRRESSKVFPFVGFCEGGDKGWKIIYHVQELG